MAAGCGRLARTRRCTLPVATAPLVADRRDAGEQRQIQPAHEAAAMELAIAAETGVTDADATYI
jgi:hypothetical protein